LAEVLCAVLRIAAAERTNLSFRNASDVTNRLETIEWIEVSSGTGPWHRAFKLVKSLAVGSPSQG
jgi:hypothetical protein